MNLAMMLSGLAPEEMCQRWRALDVRDFASLLPLRMYARGPADLPALGGPEGVVKRVFPHLGIDLDRIRATRGIQGTFNVCNYTSKTSEVIPHQELELPLLVAAISLPIFMPPVPHKGCLYMDSVWIRDANLLEAVRQGSDEIWVVWCIGNIGEYLNGAFNQYVHMIELSANGNLFKELAQIATLNERIKAGEVIDGRTEPIRVHIIHPEFPLPLDPDYYRGRIDGATLVDRGYRDATQYLARMNPAGVALDADATRMRDPRAGLMLRISLTGSLGAKPCRLDIAVEIDELAAFLADAGHGARLSGRITCPGIGDQLPATGGAIDFGRLLKLEMGFRAAEGEIRLFAEGSIRSLRIVFGAAQGKLRPGWGGLLAAALSLHATGAQGLGLRMRTVARFWRFVLFGS